MILRRIVSRPPGARDHLSVYPPLSGQSASSSRWICSAVARYAFARGLRILIESNGNATSSRNPGSSSAENITPSTQAHVLDQDPVSAAETIDRDYPAPR
jgi:hypothetical protein